MDVQLAAALAPEARVGSDHLAKIRDVPTGLAVVERRPVVHEGVGVLEGAVVHVLRE